LSAAQVIRGRVLDVQGQPVAGLTLSVVRLGKALSRHDLGFLVGLDYFDDNGPGFGSLGMMAEAKDKKRAAAVPGLRFAYPPAGLPGWPAPVTTDAQGRFELRGVGRGLGV